jgi:hypothetical protein
MYESTRLTPASLRQEELLREARSQRRAYEPRTPMRGTAGALAALPWLAKLGLTLILAGLVADPLGGAGPGSETHLGHLLVVMGMAVTLTGIVVDGVWTQLRPKGGPSHAVR